MKYGIRVVKLYVIFLIFVGGLPHSVRANGTVTTEVTVEPLPIVINELHVKPDVKTDQVEYVELYNPGPVAVSLGGWALTGGVDFVFPDGATLPANDYLLVGQNPAVLRARFGVAALGPFSGRLDNEGERLTLRDRYARVVDEVSYGYGFPWPVAGEAVDSTLQLINPALDNSLAGNWRSAPATPGGRNRVFADNPPPRIDSVEHTPQSPRSWQPVAVTVAVTDTDGIRDVTLFYQVVEPGAYIAIHDRAYQTNWATLPMQQVSGGVYRAELPADIQRHRRLVRYRIEASDGVGQRTRTPYPDDPQPNFAYFVYDGAPLWGASRDGAGTDYAVYDFSQMRPLPIYHILAKKRDVADALHMPDSTWNEGYMGHDYLWRATLVVGDRVYDHITFRARGGFTRYATGKTMWKLNLNPAHPLQAYDDWGRPFQTGWDKLNLSSVIQQTHRNRRGEQGMFESISFRLFNLAGVEAPYTYFIHFRVIDDAAEQGASQYDSDFWGLYLAIEQPDGHMLEEHNLPDGNFYKVENYQGEKNNQGATAVADQSDFDAFAGRVFYSTPDPDWWRANLDLERYYSYRSIIEAVHHYDVNQGKNYFFYNNPVTKRWSVHPWDLDATWYERMPGTGVEPFLAPVLGNPYFNLDYQNRMRSLRDLLFNPEQMNAMLDEHADFIDSAANGLSMVDADRAMWDYHPIYRTRYVDKDRTRVGHFYRFSPTRDFRGMVALMKQWVVERSAWIDATILTDRDHPYTPVLYYSGAGGFPADALRFTLADFADPQGNGDFAAFQWRIAEVTDPAAPVYQAAAPRLYEINAAWESGEVRSFQRELTPPLGVIQPDHAYRIRARMKDRSGRWSHWSAPVSFIAGPPVAPPSAELKLTEIMYHPLPLGFYESSELEFIELQNTGAQRIDLSNVRLAGGVDYRFPVGATLAPGQFAVIARNRTAFEQRYGFAPQGQFDRNLANGGDSVTLLDAFGRVIANVEYDDDAPWPKETDGKGYSLALIHKNANPSRVDAWRRSAGIHGSPGAVDPEAVVINEVLAAPLPGGYQAVELFNPTGEDVEIGGWYLTDTLLKPRKFRIPDGVTIPGNGYLVFPQYDFVRPSNDGSMSLSPAGGEVYLVSASNSRLTGHRHGFRYSASESGVTWGRYVDSVGREQLVMQTHATLGDVNAGPRTAAIVVSALTLESATTSAPAIALTNAGGNTVALFDPANPQRTWELHGGYYRFPPGIEMASGETVMITGTDPHRYCLAGDAPAPRRVFGPFTRPPAQYNQQVSLWNAQPDGATATHLPVETIDYNIAEGWPSFANVRGATLARKSLTAYGNDPANWQMMAPGLPVTESAANHPALCSFTAQVAETGEITITWTMHAEAGIAHYQLRRGDRLDVAAATIVVSLPPITMTDAAGRSLYVVVDSDASDVRPVYYWLEAVGTDDTVTLLGVTAPVQPFVHVFVPIVWQD